MRNYSVVTLYFMCLYVIFLYNEKVYLVTPTTANTHPAELQKFLFVSIYHLMQYTTRGGLGDGRCSLFREDHWLFLELLWAYFISYNEWHTTPSFKLGTKEKDDTKIGSTSSECFSFFFNDSEHDHPFLFSLHEPLTPWFWFLVHPVVAIPALVAVLYECWTPFAPATLRTDRVSSPCLAAESSDHAGQKESQEEVEDEVRVGVFISRWRSIQVCCTAQKSIEKGHPSKISRLYAFQASG